jgi:hypothetical protein
MRSAKYDLGVIIGSFKSLSVFSKGKNGEKNG